MRRQPVAFALIDAAFLADTKFRALRRRLPEPREFNSAVGAWLIVLTAARRNGLPDVDAADEAEDPTFIADLVAVGLLSSTGIPEKPYRAWAPARPRYASDVTSAPDAPKVPKVPVPAPALAPAPVPAREPPAPAGAPPPAGTSPPFPSLPLRRSLPAPAPAREPHIEAWLMVRHRLPTQRQRDFLDRYLGVFDVTGPERMAALILRHPDDPIAALKADLDAHRAERLGELDNGQAPVNAAPKREAWQVLFREKLAADEEALRAAAPLPSDS